MTTPAHMVEVSLLASSTLLFFIFLFKGLFPKKNISLFVLLICISVLPIISVFRDGVYQSGDFNLHIFRAMDFYASLQDGILLPSWAPHLNNNFGYPLFVFLNPLPYYIISLFHYLGFSFVGSMKLFLAITYIFSGIFMFIFTKKLWKNEKGAFAASIFYLFAPYHFVDQHFRVALGEITAFTFLPLFFLSLITLVRNRKPINLLYVALSFTLLFFSHQAILIFSLVVAAPFTLFYAYEKKNILKTVLLLLLSAILSLLMTSYVWLPQLTHTAFTHAYIFHRLVVDFPFFEQLLYSPWRYGVLFQGPQGELSYALGYTHLLVVALAAFLIIKNTTQKTYKRELILYIGLFFLLLFLMLPLSSFVWKTFPILNTVQFSYRILLPITFVISLLAGLVLKKANNSLATIVVFVTIALSILNWGQRTMISTIDDKTLRLLLPQATISGEGLVQASSKWWPSETQLWMPEKPKYPIEILSGKAVVKDTFRNSIRHEYILNATTPVLLKENTSYFPNWQVYIDNKPSVITYNDKEHPAVMLFSVEKGLHSIRVEYSDIPLHNFTKNVFLILFPTFILLVLLDWAVKLKRHLFRFTKK